MRKTLFLFMLLMITSVYGSQSDSEKTIRLQREVSTLKSRVSHLLQEETKLRVLLQDQSKRLDSLKAIQLQQTDNLNKFAEKTGADLSDANKKIDDNAYSLSERINSRTWIGVVGILLALGLLAYTFCILRRKIRSDASTIDKIRSAQEGLETAQKSLQEESVKLDSKLVDLLNKQVVTQPQITNSDQPDHSLALKVADEIVRIETNLSRMDESIKGYKQLKKAVERIRTNFLANGYEIVEMMGKPYNEGMKVVANFVSDDTLAEGEQKITGIIKPQINYNGKMIQSAQITVSQNL